MKTLLLLLPLILGSCAFQIKTPSTRFLSPETQGGLGEFKLQMGYFGSTASKLDISSNQLQDSLILEPNRDNFAVINTEIGLLDKMDVFYSAGGQAPDITGLKYQLIGNSRTTAKAGDHSLSVSAGYGSTSKKEADDDIFDASGNTKAHLEGSNAEVGLLYGFRISDKLLVKLGYFFADLEFEGDFESEHLSLDGANFAYDGQAQRVNLGLMQYLGNMYVLLEGSAQRVKWDRTAKDTHYFANFALGYEF